MPVDPTTGSGVATGRVHAADGWPVNDAIVTITDAHGRQVARPAIRADGSFVTEPLDPGPYIVIVSAAGHQPLAHSVQLRSSGATTLGVLTLERTEGLALPEPGVWDIDPVHSTVRATAKHLGLGKLHGHFTDFSGTIEVADPPQASTVSVCIQAGSIDTSNADRDAHLRSPDFLDVQRYPTIGFTGSSAERHSDRHWTLTGPFTMRDVTRPIELDVTYLGTTPDLWGGMRAGFSATAQLARDDFAMTWNQSVIAGITAFGRTLHINIDIQAVHRG